MTRDHFNAQVGRILHTWPKGLPEERAVLLWQAVQTFDNEWMTRAVDRVIANCRQAPLLSDFSEDISRERERQWQFQKREDPILMRPEVFEGEDQRMICRSIRDLIAGRVDLATVERLIGVKPSVIAVPKGEVRAVPERTAMELLPEPPAASPTEDPSLPYFLQQDDSK